MIIEILDKFEDWRRFATMDDVERKRDEYTDSKGNLNPELMRICIERLLKDRVRIDVLRRERSNRYFTYLRLVAVLVYPKTPEHLVVHVVDGHNDHCVSAIKDEVQDAQKRIDEWHTKVEAKVRELLGWLPIVGCYNPADISRQIWD